MVDAKKGKTSEAALTQASKVECKIGVVIIFRGGTKQQYLRYFGMPINKLSICTSENTSWVVQDNSIAFML